MTPEQLIVELEAALHQGEGHDWRLLAPLVLDVLKSMQAAHERLALKNELARLTTPRPSEPLEMDCGDNSCLFAKTRGGMRTNGGCRCLENLGFHRGERESLRRMAAEVVALRKRVSDLTTPRPIEEAPKDGTEVLVYWEDMSPEVMLWDGECKGWKRYGDPVPWVNQPTHFLPLPVKP